MNKHSRIVKEHFDIKYKDYDSLIKKLIPKYTTMHKKAVRGLLSKMPKQSNILDLGIGTGQTALEILKSQPQCKIFGIDISSGMIKQAQDRLGEYKKQIRFLNQDINNLKIKQRFDGCISVLCIHHLNEKQKLKLFRKIFSSLKPQSTFVLADLVNFPTTKETRQIENKWKRYLYNGLGKKQGEYWFQNYLEEDLPSTTSQQIHWLKKAGFVNADCIWKHLNYVVIVAKKPQ